MSEDKEASVFCGHANDALLTSAADKQDKALKHFNFFLKGHCVQIGIDVVKAQEIPFCGITCRPSNKAVFEFWDALVGAFITCMSKHARSGCNPKGQCVSLNTVDGHYSSVKVFFTDKFRNEEPVPVFQKMQWTKLREKLDNGTISPVIQSTNQSRVPSSRPRTNVRPSGKDARSNAEHNVERK